MWCSDEGGGILAGGPDLCLEELEERFGLGGGLEVEVDDDIPRIVDWPQDAVLEHAGLLTEFGEALECRVPEVAQCDDGSVAAAYALNVASSGVYARARGRVVRICDSVGDALTLRLRLVEEIGRVVGFDAYAWLMTDPETSVGSAPLADVPLLPEPAKRRDWDIAATRVER